jgi:hypothetical protein
VAENIGVPDELDITSENYPQCVFDKHENHPSIVNIKQSRLYDNYNFDFYAVNETHVGKILEKLNVKKATGYDQIPPRLIRAASTNISTTLTEIINTSLSKSTYPDDMKKAEIAPLFKKKDDMSKDNYRPVSILPTFSKVFETIICEQLMSYFTTIFSDMLCAYRTKYSCEHVLVKLLDSWKKALDSNKFVGVMSMDLSKAFDCIPHGLLIAKLKAYGFSEQACLFMSSYLSGRKQRVKVDDARSEWMLLRKGVPQGSCLGPVIFNIFINDLFYTLQNCNLSNYADDNTIDVMGDSLQLVIDALQINTESATKWFSDNFMQANPEKFQFLMLKPMSFKGVIPNHVIVNDVCIQREDSVKFLGITIDDKLKFDLHVTNLCIKAGNQLNVLYRFKNIFSIEEKKILYTTFILSNFNYCPIVWNFCNSDMMRKMEHIQERALRFIYNDTSSQYRDMLSSYKYETLHVRRIKTIACEVYKSLNNLNPQFMHDMFEKKENMYGFRDSEKLVVPNFNKIRYGRNTFSYYGSHLWNMLPVETKHATSLNVFKRMLKSWEGPNCNCSSCTFIV